MQGNYYGQAPYLISPVMGLSKYAQTLFAQGCDVNCANTDGFAGAWRDLNLSRVGFVAMLTSSVFPSQRRPLRRQRRMRL